MNLTSLRYFVAVVEAGSMREAAEGLHVAQSALSRQIQNLEQAFGAPLLSRLPRGIAPTMAGRVLLRHARDTLSAVAMAHDEIAALQGLRRGEIRIATIDPLAEDILPGLITRFQARHADISFDVRVGNTCQVQGLVREGLAEIGIGYNPPPDPDLAVLTAVDQPLTAFVAPDHPLAAHAAIALEALEGCRLILPPARSPTRRLIDEAMRRQGVTTRVAVESDSVALRLNTAARTQAVALLAELSGRTAVAQGRLAGVPIADPAVENGSIQIFALKARQRSRAVTAFLRGLQMAIRHAR